MKARQVLPYLLVLSLGWSAGGPLRAAAQQGQTPPRCTAATPAETEGPYYKGGSPQRTSLLEEGVSGTKLLVTGYVLARGDCQPVPRAWLDFWQADDRGHYDNAGYRLRGHQVTAGAGAYSLQTVLPGLYPGRTRHIHVKVRAPNGPMLTTQIYFPGEPHNQQDGLFNPILLVNLEDRAGGKVATFNFIVSGG